jgi:hypothetical protein
MSADVRLELAKATAEVAALTAERDRLREELEHRDRILDATHAKNKRLVSRNIDVGFERDALADQLARAETVVEAATAWAAEIRQPGRGHFDDLQPWPQMTALLAAVDAYQATPATTEREGAGDVVGD